jgi:tRNA(Arg) A34 adenosine deaminase TadA
LTLFNPKFMEDIKKEWMQEAIALSQQGIDCGEGGPFGAVVVKDGKIIARGYNQVVSTNDPTAHAEIVAIRAACKVLQSWQLTGCEIYTSCEPCPMCLSTIYWAKVDRVYYANSRFDAADVGFEDQLIYQELNLPMASRKLPMTQLLREEAIEIFHSWSRSIE